MDKKFKVTLNKPYLGFSNRFTRRFGSMRFMRVKCHPDLVFKRGKDLISFFKRPFVVMTRVFRAFYAKDHNVFLVATNETFSGHEILHSPKLSESSLEDFLTWHNDIRLNESQVCFSTI